MSMPHSLDRVLAPRICLRGTAVGLLASCLLFGAAAASTQDRLRSSPLGLVDIPKSPPLRAAPSATENSAAGLRTPAKGPLPPYPALTGKPMMFGSHIFSGRFGSEAFGSFYPADKIGVGDRISVLMWGAFKDDAVPTVDAQGNLYRFLLAGQIDPMQLQDGSTIVVTSRKHTAQASGEVLHPYVFEFSRQQVPAAELLALARPAAPPLSIVRRVGAQL
ncbi:MAG: hypothetical protein MUF08_04105, partial [Burkholderiaceae bacterium]|nr:hypothetical protein [Burkholderiaceae bacterium]